MTFNLRSYCDELGARIATHEVWEDASQPITFVLSQMLFPRLYVQGLLQWGFQRMSNQQTPRMNAYLPQASLPLIFLLLFFSLSLSPFVSLSRDVLCSPGLSHAQDPSASASFSFFPFFLFVFLWICIPWSLPM